jgi:hypothetical protein
MTAKKRSNSKQPAKRVAKRRTSAAAGRATTNAAKRASSPRQGASTARAKTKSQRGRDSRSPGHTQVLRAIDRDPRSTAEIWQSLGFIGCIKDGPSDLSTNPKYMEGFGES